MKYKLFIVVLLFSACAGPLRDKDKTEQETPVDRSAVDPTPKKDTVKIDSAIILKRNL